MSETRYSIERTVTVLTNNHRNGVSPSTTIVVDDKTPFNGDLHGIANIYEHYNEFNTVEHEHGDIKITYRVYEWTDSRKHEVSHDEIRRRIHELRERMRQYRARVKSG